MDAFEGLIAQARTSRSRSKRSKKRCTSTAVSFCRKTPMKSGPSPVGTSSSRAAIKALLRVAEARREEGAYEPAITALQRLLSLERTDEQAHRELMRVYALAGRRHDALRQYEQCSKVLQSELNVEPEAETTELQSSIAPGRHSQRSGYWPEASG